MQEYQKLNKNARKSWIIARLIGTLIASISLISSTIFLSKVIDNFDEIKIIFTLGISVLIIILLINSFVYPIFEYKQWSYIITNDKIEFTEGIYFKRTVIIPIIRVQHIQVNQGPINKFLNLCNIIIFTAGGQHKIPNIDTKRAEEISEYLKELIKVKVHQKLDNCEENIISDKEFENYDETK
ncbi:PH domain-containing protein [Clostridium sp. AL.422]|uniref:PH domain-containing protein n=1 Tax=Clostridium TaxID=1485 RepID=UPI00293DB48F|nr:MULTISPECIES: PH domain-containing protein [unclassified Clostridium]MDV4152692.1 PH domain-containing protein [Clostridium sp. AL.422]